MSGFIDAYTFITQGGRFASMQTGNLLYMMMKFADGHFKEAFSFFYSDYFLYFRTIFLLFS